MLNYLDFIFTLGTIKESMGNESIGGANNGK